MTQQDYWLSRREVESLIYRSRFVRGEQTRAVIEDWHWVSCVFRMHPEWQLQPQGYRGRRIGLFTATYSRRTLKRNSAEAVPR
jgi:hypothetical protein